jgi:hypothetical protein
VPVLIAAGFILGLLVGRWWTLAAAIGFGVWVAMVSEVEVPGWFLGLSGTAPLAARGSLAASPSAARYTACAARRSRSFLAWASVRDYPLTPVSSAVTLVSQR